MGGDGGVIAVKRKFIKECKTDKEELEIQKTREVMVARAFTCAITGEPLQEPVVSCRLGYIFTKENVLSALLDKRLNESFAHIRRLKDIRSLIFTPNPDLSTEWAQGTVVAKYICPITLTPFDGLHKFVAIWSTGYVLSEKALQEIGVAGLQTEYGPFTAADVVPLLPSDEEHLHRRAALEARQEVQAKAKSKKRRVDASNHSHAPDEEGDGEVRATAESEGSVAPEIKGAKGPSAAPSAVTSGSSRVKTTSALASSARAAAADNEDKSSVYKKLFHTDAEAKTSTRDLLMSVAGFRYTLS